MISRQGQIFSPSARPIIRLRKAKLVMWSFSDIDIIRYLLYSGLLLPLLTFQITVRQTVELKQVEGRERERERGGNKYNFSAGADSGGRVVVVGCDCAAPQSVWTTVIVSSHSESSPGCWQHGSHCTGKTDTGLPCHSIYHKEGKEKIIILLVRLLLCVVTG